MEAEESITQEMSNLSLEYQELDQLIQRSETLLKEVDAFVSYLKERPRLDKVEYRQFRTNIKIEHEGLLKLKEKNLSLQRTQHSTRSSNVPYLLAIWDVAKRSRGVVSLKRFNAVPDLVTEGGLRWTKISLLNQKRLLHEMAKQGWQWSGQSDSESDDDDEMEHRVSKEDAMLDIPIVKVAQQLAQAASTTRVKYTHPSITYILPNISRGAQPDTDKVLDMISAKGIQVICANDVDGPAPPLSEVLPHPLVHDPFTSFSSTINIDCTILLAMVSDISHATVPPQDRRNTTVLRQLSAEEKEQLMPNVLWPAMATRQLECTQLAAQRMQEITDLIGTDTEKQRMRILLGITDAWSNVSREQLISAFEALSCHTVPVDWQIPIHVVSENVTADDARLPAAASHVAARLTDINSSVCLHGWATGHTTITSNRTVAKGIERLVEEQRMSDADAGPDVWVCWTSRSLVAKEKDRKSA